MKAFLFVIIFMSLLVFVTATEKHVIFNGDFFSNTTLYSNISFFSQVNVTGKDVYPIKENCTNIVVCNRYNYTTNKTCLNYSERTGRCIKWQKEKINFGCIKYKTIRKCNPLINTTILCQNPTGPITNQFSLGNFYYTINNGTNWTAMNYSRLIFYNITIQFKVNIPFNCSPTYDINKAINLSY